MSLVDVERLRQIAEVEFADIEQALREFLAFVRVSLAATSSGS